MQASSNMGRTPERQVGRSRLLAVSAALVMALAALLLTLAFSSSMEPSNAAVQKKLPYTFFFTHYQLLGDPNTLRLRWTLDEEVWGRYQTQLGLTGAPRLRVWIWRW